MTGWPRCSCHGERACVHRTNHQHAVDTDPERGWDWHCAVDGRTCDGYSLVLLWPSPLGA